MDLLRAQALKSVEPKTTKKRKSAGSTEDGEIVEEVYKGGKYTTAVLTITHFLERVLMEHIKIVWTLSCRSTLYIPLELVLENEISSKNR